MLPAELPPRRDDELVHTTTESRYRAAYEYGNVVAEMAARRKSEARMGLLRWTLEYANDDCHLPMRGRLNRSGRVSIHLR
jgi:hypothetical protein